MHTHVYIYIYRERERCMYMHTYIVPSAILYYMYILCKCRNYYIALAARI